MKAVNESRPVKARLVPPLSDEHLQRIRATRTARVQVRVVDAEPRVRRAFGLLSQLRAAGWVPQSLPVDEAARAPVQWRDEAGRTCMLRPYGRLQWEARQYRLPQEVEAARRAHAADKRAADRRYELARRARQLEAQLHAAPRDAADFREKLLEVATRAAAEILSCAHGERWPGFALADKDGRKLYDALLASLAIVGQAEVRADTAAARALRAELRQIEARLDPDFQRFLQRLGGVPPR